MILLVLLLLKHTFTFCFLRNSTSLTATAAVYSYVVWMNTFFANKMIRFLINDKSTFINGSRSLPRNPLGCTIWNSWYFDNFMLTSELYAEALQRLETFLSVNSKLCRKLFLLVAIIFRDNLKVTPIAFFVIDFSLSRRRFDNVTFTLSYFILIPNKLVKYMYNTLLVPSFMYSLNN